MRAMALAVVAAVALGLFTYFLGLGSREGSALSTLAGARVGSLGVPARVLAVRRRETLSRRAPVAPPVLAIGLLRRTSANALFTPSRAATACLRSSRCSASLYPVMTVVLAYLVLHERLRPSQVAGRSRAALAGVAALSAGLA